GERFRDGLGSGSAFVAKEVAVLKPDHFAAAEEGECLKCFTKPRDSSERFAAIVDGSVDDLVVHSSELSGPFIVQLTGALFDGELIFAKHQADGWGRLR